MNILFGNKHEKLIKSIGDGMLLCQCPACGSVFLVAKNEGAMRCPHCMAKCDGSWGRLKIKWEKDKQ